MTNTDSTPFQDLTPAISLRELERGSEIGAGWDPTHHQPTDVFSHFSDGDFSPRAERYSDYARRRRPARRRDAPAGGAGCAIAGRDKKIPKKIVVVNGPFRLPN